MRITVEAPFDLGLTFGLGGSLFEDTAKLEALRVASETIFGSGVEVHTASAGGLTGAIDDVSAIPYGVRQPYGAGVRLKLSPGAFTALWSETARTFWRQFRTALLKEFGDGIYREVEEKLPLVAIPHATLFAFELGVAYVRLHLDPPPLASAEAARGLFKAFENAGYGDVVAGPVSNAMLAEWRTAFQKIYGQSSEISILTERAISPGSVEVAGFQGLVFTSRAAMDLKDQARLFRPGDALAAIRYGDLSVTASWLITLADGEPGFEYDYNRLLYIGMCHRLAWEICRIFEDVFAEKMRLSIRASVEDGNGALSRKQLNRIRQFAALVLSATSVENLSDYSGDLDFSAFFDRYANITKRHSRISLAAAALAEVEADIVVTDERRVSKSVNMILLVLTIVSLVGVSAGVIQTWESGLQLFQTAPLLILTLVAPSLVAMIAILAGRRFGG